MLTDPIADLLTRIRNAQRVRHAVFTSPASKMRAQVLEVLKNEGYIRGYRETELRPQIKQLEVELKYIEDQPVIQEIVRISKPGRRVYVAVDAIKPV
ncbi:30S ribosomal protein S8, partial [Shewanella algae]|uniref:30S ribosomal protein S8 n=1 Tax=Shewanella algae TaxID=38313 RepID=UPI00313AF6E2